MSWADHRCRSPNCHTCKLRKEIADWFKTDEARKFIKGKPTMAERIIAGMKAKRRKLR